MSTPTPNYQRLAAAHTRLHRLQHLQSIASWDEAACMPPGGAEARAAAMSELAGLLHRERTDPTLGTALTLAAQEPLDDWQRANLREMQRDWDASTALPEPLVERRQLATSRCEHAWRTQRAANDWKGFLPNFQEVVRVARQEAELLAERSGLSRYEALMDRFEPGMTCAEVDRLFNDLKQWLPALIVEVQARQAASPAALLPQGPFPIPAQKALCESVMRLLGFDFNAGRLDVSHHPFAGGVPEDVRITTRYREDDFLPSLMGTIHETGHARYEQGRPRAWLGQPVSEARSMGIHESQSLAFENQMGCHPGFVRLIAPLVGAHLGDQPAFEPHNLWRLLTRVQPGRIRVDADEVTYPAHVILRYEIERDLIEGRIEAADIPELWNRHMAQLLGMDTRGDFKDGPMQDVHWPAGMFGYFPCYTLGAMYAAQWFAALRQTLPDLDVRLAGGDIAPVIDWLQRHIWQQGSRWTTPELVRRASGEDLNPAHFKAHLHARYLG